MLTSLLMLEVRTEVPSCFIVPKQYIKGMIQCQVENGRKNPDYFLLSFSLELWQNGGKEGVLWCIMA